MAGRSGAGQKNLIRPVSNTSPLIAFSYLGELSILHRLFNSEILIPPAVANELRGHVLPDWIQVRAPKRPVDAPLLRASLGPGESEAIALALEVSADPVLLDDKAARRMATVLGLPLIGTLGMLLKAKHAGLIPAIRPRLEVLQKLPFHIAPGILEAALYEAGE